MPLEPLPPPSPRGKIPPPPPNSSQTPQPKPKHKCSGSQPCEIRLSDIGKVFHTFPKGTFRTRYTPPVIPKSVLDYFVTHPFTWSWTTKSGPNAGKSFPVPYIPTFCRKFDNRSVHWTVDLFHSFKAHLSPQLLDAKGRVPTPLVRIYQSNMLMHFRRQALSTKQLPKPASIPPPPPPPPKQRGSDDPPTKPTTELERLRAEVTRLRKRVADLLSRHRASHPSLLYPPYAHLHVALIHRLQTLRLSLIRGVPRYLASLTNRASNDFSTTPAVLSLSGQSTPPLPSPMSTSFQRMQPSYAKLTGMKVAASPENTTPLQTTLRSSKPQTAMQKCTRMSF